MRAAQHPGCLSERHTARYAADGVRLQCFPMLRDTIIIAASRGRSGSCTVDGSEHRDISSRSLRPQAVSLSPEWEEEDYLVVSVAPLAGSHLQNNGPDVGETKAEAVRGATGALPFGWGASQAMTQDADDNQERLQRIDRGIAAIKRRYSTALRYRNKDPETALMHARKAAEAICHQLFIHEIGPNLGNLMLGDLIQKLHSKGVLPKSMVVQFQTIQTFGNFGSHDQPDDGVDISREFAQPCLQALAVVVQWYTETYRKALAPPSQEPAAGSSVTGTAIQGDASKQTGVVRTTRRTSPVRARARTQPPSAGTADADTEHKPAQISPARWRRACIASKASRTRSANTGEPCSRAGRTS